MRAHRASRRVLVTAAFLAAIGLASAFTSTLLERDRRADALATSTVVCNNGSGTRGTADATVFNLSVTEGYMSTPDGNSVYMWSYGVDPPGPTPATFQTPGPTLCVDVGDAVTLNLAVPSGFPTSPPGPYNTRTSMVFPGQSVVAATGGVAGTLTNEVNGGTVSYSFTAASPGTYLYESGTDRDLQVHMGLYGGLLVYPTGAGAGTAYGANSGTAFDPSREYLLIMHEVDPDLHHAIEVNTAATAPAYAPADDPPGTRRHYRYWTISGRSMPDTLAENFAPWLPDQPYGSLVQLEGQDPEAPGLPALIRYANAGLENHPFHPHGNHLRLVAQDGRLLADSFVVTSFEAFTKTVASGQTFDLLAQWLDVEAWNAAGNPVPVTVPGLQNLVFVDDATFYSGSPYLGLQDELPAGVTSFSECGEYYFPWHSHALFEFQNFNEGFGGLATMWRIDPPGGCA